LLQSECLHDWQNCQRGLGKRVCPGAERSDKALVAGDNKTAARDKTFAAVLRSRPLRCLRLLEAASAKTGGVNRPSSAESDAAEARDAVEELESVEASVLVLVVQVSVDSL
jgi:hypothetical protein